MTAHLQQVGEKGTDLPLAKLALSRQDVSHEGFRLRWPSSVQRVLHIWVSESFQLTDAM